MKKIIALLLALITAFSLAVSPAFAADLSCRDELTETAWNALMKVLGSDEFNDAFDAITTSPTFSKLQKDRSYTNYLSIGDSVANGYGIASMGPSSWSYLNTKGWGKADSAAWTYKLAEELGLQFEKQGIYVNDGTDNTPWYLELDENNHFANIGRAGMRAYEVYNWVSGDDSSEDQYFKVLQSTEGETGSGYFVYKENRIQSISLGDSITDEDLREHLQRNISKADLISLAVGGNDVSSMLVSSTLGLDYGWDLLFDQYPELGLKAAADVLIPAFKEILHSDELSLDVMGMNFSAEGLVYSLLGFVTYYGKAVDKIHKLSPDADILLVGLFNPYEYVYYQSEELTNNEKIYITKAMNLYIGMINYIMYSYAESHASYAAYVNIMDVELLYQTEEYAELLNYDYNLATNPDIASVISANYLTAGHQSPAGHDDIKARVLSILKSNDDQGTDAVFPKIFIWDSLNIKQRIADYFSAASEAFPLFSIDASCFKPTVNPTISDFSLESLLSWPESFKLFH